MRLLALFAVQRCYAHVSSVPSRSSLMFECFYAGSQRTFGALQVQVTDPKALERIRQEEMDISMRRINKILAAGANVVLTTKGIDDFCLKAFVEAGCLACRRVPKDDLKRIARATGAYGATAHSHRDALADCAARFHVRALTSASE